MASMEKLLEQGWELYKRGQIHQAATLLEKALGAKVDDSGLTHYRLGFCYRDLGQHERALQHFQAAVDAYPENPWHQFQIGKEMALQNRWKEALPGFALTIEQHPAFPAAYHDAGTCTAMLRQFDLATRCYSLSALLCDLAANNETETGITSESLADAAQKLKLILGISRYGAIQEELLAQLGIDQQPQTGDFIHEEDLQKVATDIVAELRKL